MNYLSLRTGALRSSILAGAMALVITSLFLVHHGIVGNPREDWYRIRVKK